MTQVRAAAAGVRDDRVVAIRRQQVDHRAGRASAPARARRCARAAIRSTAAPAACRPAAVGEQDVGRVAIECREDQILHAAGQQRDAIAAPPSRALRAARSARSENAGAIRGACGSSRRERRRQQPHQPRAAHQRFQPAALIETAAAVPAARSARGRMKRNPGVSARQNDRASSGVDVRALDLAARRLEAARRS